MSKVHSGQQEWHLYVHDMIEFAKKTMLFTDGMDQDAFVGDVRTYDATLRNLELIGEAATHIPDEIRRAHQDIPWHAIIGLRNRLAHGYLGIDDDVVWSVVQDAIPTLLTSLRGTLGATGTGN